MNKEQTHHNVYKVSEYCASTSVSRGMQLVIAVSCSNTHVQTPVLVGRSNQCQLADCLHCSLSAAVSAAHGGLLSCLMSNLQHFQTVSSIPFETHQLHKFVQQVSAHVLHSDVRLVVVRHSEAILFHVLLSQTQRCWQFPYQQEKI